MAATNKNKHMTENERKIIESSIRNGATHTAIAQVIGKDKSTIGKEIRLHRVQTYKCSLPLECANRSKCSHNHSCKLECPGYIRFKCSRRDRSPGHAMAALNFIPADSINMSISPKQLTENTGIRLSIQEWA